VFRGLRRPRNTGLGLASSALSPAHRARPKAGARSSPSARSQQHASEKSPAAVSAGRTRGSSRSTRWPSHNRPSPRRDPLGRGRHLTRLRTPPPPRPTPHRPDLDGRPDTSAGPRSVPSSRRCRSCRAAAQRAARDLSGSFQQVEMLMGGPRRREPPIMPSGRQDVNLRPLDPRSAGSAPAPTTLLPRGGRTALRAHSASPSVGHRR
jgi:hypothetical protein